MARASKISCNPDDLRRQGSAVRGAQGYANHHGACSNRDALPVCMTRHPRQFAADRCCRPWIVEPAARDKVAASSGGCAPVRTCDLRCSNPDNRNPRGTFCPTSAPALVTSNGSDAHSFARAARGCASGPARRMLGRADEHGCGTRDAGRWPWRASAGVIKSRRAGLSTVRELLHPRDRPHY